MEKKTVFRTGKRIILGFLLVTGFIRPAIAQQAAHQSAILRQLMDKVRLEGFSDCIPDLPAPRILAEPRFTKGTRNIIGIVLPAADSTNLDPANIKEPFIITQVSNDAGTDVLPFPRPVLWPPEGNVLETVNGLLTGKTYTYTTALFLPVCLVNCSAVVDTSQLELHCSPYSDSVWSVQDSDPPLVQNVLVPALADSPVAGWLNRSQFSIRAQVQDAAGVWQAFLYRRGCDQDAWSTVADTTFDGRLTAVGYAFREERSVQFRQNLPDGCYEFRFEGKDATHSPESFFPNFILAGNGGEPASGALPQVQIRIDTTPPQPVDLSCRQVQNSIVLNWQASADPSPGIGLQAYRILKNGVLIATVPATDAVFVDDLSGVRNVQDFEYRVQPVDSLGNIQVAGGQARCTFHPLDIVHMQPEPAFTPGNSNQVCWNRPANVDTVTLFLAENCDFANPAQVQLSDTCFTFTGLKDGLEYCYWLTATDSFGRAVRSDTVTSIQDATAPVLHTVDIEAKKLLGGKVWVNQKTIQLRVQGDEAPPGQWRELAVFEQGVLTERISLGGAPATLDSALEYRIQAGECQPVRLDVQLTDAAGNSSVRQGLDLRVDSAPPEPVGGVTCTQLQQVNGVVVEWNATADAAGCSGLAGYRLVRNGTVVAELAADVTRYDDLFAPQQATTEFTYQVQPFDSVGNVQENGGLTTCDFQGMAAIDVDALPEFLPGLSSEVCWTVTGELSGLTLFVASEGFTGASDSVSISTAQLSGGCHSFNDLRDGTKYFYWLEGIDAQRRVSFSDTVAAIQDNTLPVVDGFSLPTAERVNDQLWTYSRDLEFQLTAHDAAPGEIWQAEISENGQVAETVSFRDSLSRVSQKIAYQLRNSLAQSNQVEVQVVVVDGAGNGSKPQVLSLHVQEGAPAMFAFPNPFNPETGDMTIRLADTGETEVKIYDFFGNLVQTLSQKENNHDFVWDGRNGRGEMVANGGYVCVGTRTQQRFKIGVVKRKFIN